MSVLRNINRDRDIVSRLVFRTSKAANLDLTEHLVTAVLTVIQCYDTDTPERITDDYCIIQMTNILTNWSGNVERDWLRCLLLKQNDLSFSEPAFCVSDKQKGYNHDVRQFSCCLLDPGETSVSAIEMWLRRKHGTDDVAEAIAAERKELSQETMWDYIPMVYLQQAISDTERDLLKIAYIRSHSSKLKQSDTPINPKIMKFLQTTNLSKYQDIAKQIALFLSRLCTVCDIDPELDIVELFQQLSEQVPMVLNLTLAGCLDKVKSLNK